MKRNIWALVLAAALILGGCAGEVTPSAAAASVASGTEITAAGTYRLTGSLDSCVIVDAEDQNVTLILDNVQISSPDSEAIWIQHAKAVTIRLVGSSTLTGGTGDGQDEKADGVIYAKSDLTLTGSGTLTVTGEEKGIVCKGALTVDSGTYQVDSGEHCITAKDSASISGGTLILSGSEDGIHVKDSDDTTLGNLTVTGGEIQTDVQGDAISATGNITIRGGTFSLVTGGGSANAEPKTVGFGFPGQSQKQSSDDTSRKGIKADGTITVTGGTFTLDTVDDGFHAAGDITLEDGEFTISTGDDAIHSDENVVINGGTYSIPVCYEGVEGITVTVNGGTLDIVSSDDGLNAADGSGANTLGNPNSANIITVNGGTVTIVADGDCLDSNGDILLTGGTLKLTCNGNGNTAIDCDGNYENTGADLTTNDGSENNPGGMPGGMGNPGGFGGMGGPGGGRPEGTPPQGGNAPGSGTGENA